MLLRRFNTWLQLDTRSLAVFRWALGLCLSFDLFQKLVYANDFYSDGGLFPRTVWMNNFMSSWKISLLLANGEVWFQYAFVALALFFALLFTVGYRTRLFQILLLIFLGSIQSRNNLLLSCADDLLRLALFWSLFVPLDRHYTFAKSKNEPEEIGTVYTLPLIFQLLIMYFMTALYKVHPVWTEEHSAIYYALNVDHFTTHVGKWLKDYIGLGVFLTQSTLVWEFVGPFLVLTPILKKQIRFAVALGFIFFHIGLGICMQLGTFPWICSIYWLLFVPGEAWDKLFTFIGDKTRMKMPTLSALKFSSSGAQPKAIVVLMYVFFALVVIQNIADYKKTRTPELMRHVLWTMNLNQIWDMFAPYPVRNDGWFVVEGHFANGESRDLLTGGPVTFEKPDLVSDLYPTGEWRKFYLNLWDRGDEAILLPYARFLCRSKVSTAGDSALSTLKVYFMKETTPPMGQPFPPVERVELWSHDCFKK